MQIFYCLSQKLTRLFFLAVDFIYERIEEIEDPELDEIAHRLKDRFQTLYIAVRRSLMTNKVELSEAKELIHLDLVENLRSIPNACITRLRSIEDMKTFLTFLIDYHFIGYLNYTLLKKIACLTKDSSIIREFEQYEYEYYKLFKIASFKDIMEMFCQYPHLKPSTAIGLPHIEFRLEKPWLIKRVYRWFTAFSVFLWSDNTLLHEITENCVTITYALLPSILTAVSKDLRDPIVLKKLQDIGVTVVQVPDEDDVMSLAMSRSKSKDNFITLS